MLRWLIKLFANRRRAADPLRVFDQVLELLTRRGSELRRSAATLLALREELKREVGRCETQLEHLKGREHEARVRGDAAGADQLVLDQAHTRRLLAAAEASLSRTDVNTALLTEAAAELRERESALRAERLEAEARLRAGEATVTIGQGTQSVEWALTFKLDEARDEVERAHALASAYREGRGG